MNKRVEKNVLFRVVHDLDKKMYPLGIKEEVKYVEELNTALNNKYSKVEIANMLRRIMSYVILTNSSVNAIAQQAKIVDNTFSKKEIAIIANYIIANNLYIAKINRALI